MDSKLADHYTLGKLLKFTIPSICMMIVTSIYGVVDGIWGAVVAAEALSVILSVIMLFAHRKKYEYF